MQRNQRFSNLSPLLAGFVCLAAGCTSTEPDPMGSESDMSGSTDMTANGETMMGEAESAADSSMESGDGDAGDGDGDMSLDCSTIVPTGNTPNTVPQDFSLPGSDGAMHSLHSYCNEVVYAVTGTMW